MNLIKSNKHNNLQTSFIENFEKTRDRNPLFHKKQEETAEIYSYLFS
jgi:hypothetical protein